MPVDYKQIGKRIKKKRMERGFTQAEVAAMLSVSSSYVCQLESGTTKINIQTLSKIADFLDSGICEFISTAPPAIYHADAFAESFEIVPGSEELLDYIKAYTKLDPVPRNFDKIVHILTMTLSEQEKKEVCYMLAGYLTNKWKKYLTEHA